MPGGKTVNTDVFGEFHSALLTLKARLIRPDAGQQSETLLKQVDAALERLGRGRYGICRECSLVMPRAELLRRPYAERCERCRLRKRSARRGAGSAEEGLR